MFGGQENQTYRDCDYVSQKTDYCYSFPSSDEDDDDDESNDYEDADSKRKKGKVGILSPGKNKTIASE